MQRIGFIGTGTITAAVIDGLATSPAHPAEIIVSSRNAEIAARLAARHAFVRVAPDNQTILDQCEVVCLAVRPQIAQEVLAALRFSARHHVLSFIAALRLDQLSSLLPDVEQIVRLAPLPMVARRLGTTIVYPKDSIASELFNQVGTAFETDDEQAFDVLCAATALMGPFFAAQQQQADWLTANGIDPAVARLYLASLYLGLSTTANESGTSFGELANEFSTRGGLNEQVRRELATHGAFEAYSGALDRILRRIQNR